MKTYKIAVLEGDGIGPEVMKEAIKILDKVSEKFNLKFEYNYADFGGVAYDKHKNAFPEETKKICEKSDAILFGSIGGPKWDSLPKEEKVETALLRLRKHFDFFANLRPAYCYKPLVNASPLRPDIIGDGFDIMIVRELSSGIYFGKHLLEENKATDEMSYSKKEIERVVKVAFEVAQKRNKKVALVDKANVLSCSILFRKTFDDVSKQYPDIATEHLYVDNASIQLIKRPRDFDVIVTGNMFGDILSDEAAILTGSLGLLPSASLNEKGFGMYEPAGGSAPDIAGKGVANPIAQILSAAMMLKYSFNEIEAGHAIESTMIKVLEEGYRTADIMEKGKKQIKTAEMGTLIAEKI